MLHFIWVFAVCKSTRLGVSLTQRVNNDKFICPLLIMGRWKDKLLTKVVVIENLTFIFSICF